MPEVVLEYCVSCGYLRDAMQMVEEILARDAARLTGLRLAMVSGAIFRIHVDGVLVWDGKKDPWEPSVVRARVAEKLDAM